MLVLVLAAGAGARAAPLERAPLDTAPLGNAPSGNAPRIGPDQIVPHLSARRDPGGGLGLGDVMRAPGAMAPIAGGAVNFGYTRDAIWLRLPLHNTTATHDWRLRLHENFFQSFDAWITRAGAAPVHLVAQDTTTGFATRPVAWPELVVPFALAPGASAQIWLRYQSGGSSEVEMSLFTAPAFDAFADRRMARDFLFYGVLICLIVTALIIWAITRRGIFGVYAAYAASGLLFVAHGDGNSFRYLWPDAPGFNAFASIPLGAGIIVAGAVFARQFLQTARYHPVFDRILRADIALGLGLVAASAVADTQVIKKLLVLAAFLSLLLFTVAGLNAARTRLRAVRFYVLAWSGAVVSSALMTARHWLGFEMSEEVQFGTMRAVLVADAALMGLAILDRFNQLRLTRAQATQTALANARRNLALSRRLADLEARYDLATARSATQARRVADMIHDLRQPLHALRLNVRGLIAGEAGPDAAALEDSFAYIEGLVGAGLDAPTGAGEAAGAAAGGAAPLPDPGHGAGAGDGATALAEVLAALAQMFGPEAAARGLALRIVPAQARIDLPALDVMRIGANLVGNALRYTPAGGVVVGARRGPGGALRIEVHDSGPGLAPDDFARAQARHVRLDARPDAAPGSGLGLAIVAGICARHGLGLGLRPRRQGTGIAVTIPARRVEMG